LEVWLKNNTFITIHTQAKSDIVEKVTLYHAGDEKVLDFKLYDRGRASLGAIYARIRSIRDDAVSLFPVNSWQLYCEVFDIGNNSNTLDNAKNVLSVLKDLSKELRERFRAVEEMLMSVLYENTGLKDTFRSGNLLKDDTFKPGDLLKDEDDQVYWFLGEMDEAGNYWFLNDIFCPLSFDYNTFKVWEKLDTLCILEEILKRFYTFFDPNFIETVLKPVTEVLGCPPVDSATIRHNCEPFKKWVKQKKTIVLYKNPLEIEYRFKVEEPVEVSVIMSPMACSIELITTPYDFVSRVDTRSEGFFNLFLCDILSYTDGISYILGMLSEIYEMSSYEIAKLDLTTAFINIYNMWEQIWTSVRDLDKYTDEYLLNNLLPEFQGTHTLHDSKSDASKINAFGVDYSGKAASSGSNKKGQMLRRSQSVESDSRPPKDALEDTYESMPWDKFLQTATAIGFKIGCQGTFSCNGEESGKEVVMYREDGLILYAYSFLDSLATAEVYGEIASDIPMSVMAELTCIDAGNNGSVHFSKSVLCDMLLFLDQLEQVQLAPVWSGENTYFSILNSNDRSYLELERLGDLYENEKTELQLRKLSCCCDGAKKILAPYFRSNFFR